MKGFTAEGQVWLLGAHVGRQLVFDGASLSNEHGEALFADRLNVRQNMRCGEGFTTQVRSRCEQRTSGGQLIFNGAHLSNEQGSAWI
jgi:hypothetical protein